MPQPDIDTPIWSLFEAMTRHQPDRVAVDDGTTTLSYHRLHARALSFAAELARLVPATGLIAVVTRHSACHPVAVLACLASGRACLVLDAHHPAARNAQVIADARAGAVVFDRLAPEQMPALPGGCARLDAEYVADATFTATPAATDAPAFVISTSGSTGAPKGIVLSQRNMLHQFVQDAASCALTTDDRFLPLGSPAAISPLRGLLSALLSGGTLYLRDLHDGFARIFATLRDQRITVSRIGPSLLRAMVALPGAADAFGSMRIIRVGGETLAGQDVTRMRDALPPGCTLVFAYGSTELPPVIERLIPAHGPIEDGPLSIGTPLPGSELRLVDPHGAEVSPGDPGELLVCGPHLALGYWVDGACLPGAITPVTGRPGHRRFRSGDILRRRTDGQWEFVGRADHQLKIRGNRVEPAETEAVLRALPGVSDAVVLPSMRDGEASLVAFVVASIPADVLRRTLAELLPDHARPSRIRLVAAIPRLNTFKPDVAALRRLEGEG